jgi:hypothetical protein
MDLALAWAARTISAALVRHKYRIAALFAVAMMLFSASSPSAVWALAKSMHDVHQHKQAQPVVLTHTQATCSTIRTATSRKLVVSLAKA